MFKEELVRTVQSDSRREYILVKEFGPEYTIYAVKGFTRKVIGKIFESKDEKKGWEIIHEFNDYTASSTLPIYTIAKSICDANEKGGYEDEETYQP